MHLLIRGKETVSHSAKKSVSGWENWRRRISGRMLQQEATGRYVHEINRPRKYSGALLLKGLDPALIAQGEAALTVGLAEEGEPLLHLLWQGRTRFQAALKQVLAIGLQLEATAGLYRI